MLLQTIEALFCKYRLFCYRKLFSAVREKLEAGASLVQLYTGFIYEGPAVVRRMCQELVAAGRVQAQSR